MILPLVLLATQTVTFTFGPNTSARHLPTKSTLPTDLGSPLSNDGRTGTAQRPSSRNQNLGLQPGLGLDLPPNTLAPASFTAGTSAPSSAPPAAINELRASQRKFGACLRLPAALTSTNWQSIQFLATKSLLSAFTPAAPLWWRQREPFLLF